MVFTEQERRIFGPYIDRDGKTVKVDPVKHYRRLILYTGGELNNLLARYQEGEMGIAASAEHLAQATIESFNLTPFDQSTGEGTLQDEALAFLGNFLEWRDQKKTPAANSPTSAPPTARQPCSPCGQKAAARQVGHAPPGRNSTTRPITPSAST